MRILQSNQIEYTESGEVVSKGTAKTKNARDMLRKQHGRDRRPRQKMSLDEFLKDNPQTGANK